MSKNETMLHERVKSRLATVPAAMRLCSSLGAMMAAALFCLHDYRKELTVSHGGRTSKRRGRRYETVADVLEAASKPSSALTETLSAIDPAAYRQFDVEFRKAVAIGPMDLADVLNDRSLSQNFVGSGLRSVRRDGRGSRGVSHYESIPGADRGIH